MCMMRIGTLSLFGEASRLSPIPRAGGGDVYGGDRTMTNENWSLLGSASEPAKRTEGCSSTPKDQPSGLIGASSDLERPRRSVQGGLWRLIRAGLVMKLQRGLGFILSVLCRASYRVYRTLYDFEQVVWSRWEEPIESELLSLLQDGSSKSPPSQARFAFMRDIPGAEHGDRWLFDGEEYVNLVTGEVIVPAQRESAGTR